MEKHASQIDRIRVKLRQAKKVDRELKVFGAASHKYRIGKPVSERDVVSFESKYSIRLPDCYRSFLLKVGNTGVGFQNSGAGPFYGIYPLGDGADELLFENTEKYLKGDCILSPELSDENWKALTLSLQDEHISDEDYDEQTGRIYGGILPIGTQGCSYLHGIVLNGQFSGKVVNLDLDQQKPQFAFEQNFLDWYERWLDEVISKDLIKDGPSWFGYTIGGTEASLIEIYKSNPHPTAKEEVLASLMTKRELGKKSLLFLHEKYQIEKGELALNILEILVKHDYLSAKQHLLDLGKEDLQPVFQTLFQYAREKSAEWKDFVEQNINRIEAPETFRFCTYLLMEMNFDYGQLIGSFIKHENSGIRSSTVYSIGKLENKENYLDILILGLNDKSTQVILYSLQALSGVTNQKLLPHYKNIANIFLVEENYILCNLEQRLSEFKLNLTQIRNLDLVHYEFPSKNKWYQFGSKARIPLIGILRGGKNDRKMSDLQYNQVIEYLRAYSTDMPPYDANGVMHLLKAVLENLEKHHIDADLKQYADCLDIENENLLKKLLKYIPISKEANKEDNPKS